MTVFEVNVHNSTRAGHKEKSESVQYHDKYSGATFLYVCLRRNCECYFRPKKLPPRSAIGILTVLEQPDLLTVNTQSFSVDCQW